MAAKVKASASAGNVQGTLSEVRLRALLDNDCVDNRVVVSEKSDKISRKHYASLLGCTRSALTRFGPVFAEYEHRLGIQTGPMRHLSDMRDWLATAYDARQLEFRDGKVDRIAFQRHFRLRGGSYMTRYPQIRALFDEFDSRADSEAYLSLARQDELDRVRTALADSPVLNKDRMTINQIVLAKAAQVPKHMFREKLFADLLAMRQAEIMEGVKASRIDPFVHNRVYPFSGLAPPWPEHFLERVGVRFKQVVPNMAQQATKQPYLQLVNMLNWVGKSSNTHCRAVVAEANESGRILSANDWEEALFSYRDYLIAKIAVYRLYSKTRKFS